MHPFIYVIVAVSCSQVLAILFKGIGWLDISAKNLVYYIIASTVFNIILAAWPKKPKRRKW
jgi:hypothetical protein